MTEAMTLKPVRYMHVTDAPIVLRDNDILQGEHIRMGGTLIGRVLFTSLTAVVCEGNNISIIGNYIERI